MNFVIPYDTPNGEKIKRFWVIRCEPEYPLNISMLLTLLKAKMALTLGKYKSHIIIGVVALVTILGVCLYAYFDIKHKNALAAEIAVQQFQIEQMKIQAEMIQKDQAAIIKHSQQMIKNLTKIRTESAEQQKKITKYDLDKIAAKHPKMLENHINKATKDTFSRLEALTQP